MANALDLLAGSDELDSIVVVVATTRANDVDAVLSAIVSVADRHRGLPVALVVLGTSSLTAVGQRRIPVFDLPERAVAALARAVRYAAWRSEPLGARTNLSDVDSAAARAVVLEALVRDAGWQAHPRIADILGRYGMRAPSSGTIT